MFPSSTPGTQKTRGKVAESSLALLVPSPVAGRTKEAPPARTDELLRQTGDGRAARGEEASETAREGPRR